MYLLVENIFKILWIYEFGSKKVNNVKINSKKFVIMLDITLNTFYSNLSGSLEKIFNLSLIFVLLCWISLKPIFIETCQEKYFKKLYSFWGTIHSTLNMTYFIKQSSIGQLVITGSCKFFNMAHWSQVFRKDKLWLNLSWSSINKKLSFPKERSRSLAKKWISVIFVQYIPPNLIIQHGALKSSLQLRQVKNGLI